MSSKNPLPPEPSAFNLSGLQLLIVEADRDTRLLYTCLFEDYGAQVLAVTSLAEALKVLEFRQPHLLISEICLPDRDGYRLICRKRPLETPQGQIETIAITAFTNKNQLEESSLSQFQKCLTQPLSLYKLVELIAKLRERKILDHQ